MLRSVFKTLGAGENTLVFKTGASELWLVAANVEETDSALKPILSNTASLWIQDPTEANSISLGHGLLVNGQLAGYGCFPLDLGNEIIAKFWHSTAGNIGKLNLLFMTRAEVIKHGLVPNWTVRPSGVANFPAGKLRLIKVAGLATVVVIDLRPAVGFTWQVIEAWCRHDDGVVRDMTWSYHDGTDSISKQPYAGKGAGNAYHLGQATTSQYGSSPTMPIVLTRDVYCQVTISALAAGKKLYADALVLEYAE